MAFLAGGVAAHVMRHQSDNMYPSTDVVVGLEAPAPVPFSSLRVRDKVFKVIDDPRSCRLARVYNLFMNVAVVASTTCLCLETLPHNEAQRRRDGSRGNWFFIDAACVGLFAAELVLLVAVHRRRRRLLRSLSLYIDLLVIIPFVVELVVPTVSLRLFRISRALKLSNLLNRKQRVVLHAIVASRDAIIMLCIILSTCMLLMASLVYYVERGEWDDEEGAWLIEIRNDETGQLERVHSQFASIQVSLWWCIVTITTVGFGDVAPSTGPGQVVASITLLLGTLIVALPASVLASNLLEAWHVFTVEEITMKATNLAVRTLHRRMALVSPIRIPGPEGEDGEGKQSEGREKGGDDEKGKGEEKGQGADNDSGKDEEDDDGRGEKEGRMEQEALAGKQGKWKRRGPAPLAGNKALISSWRRRQSDGLVHARRNGTDFHHAPNGRARRSKNNKPQAGEAQAGHGFLQMRPHARGGVALVHTRSEAWSASMPNVRAERLRPEDAAQMRDALRVEQSGFALDIARLPRCVHNPDKFLLTGSHLNHSESYVVRSWKANQTMSRFSNPRRHSLESVHSNFSVLDPLKVGASISRDLKHLRCRLVDPDEGSSEGMQMYNRLIGLENRIARLKRLLQQRLEHPQAGGTVLV